MHYESIVNTEKTTLGFVFKTLFMNGVKSTIKLNHPMQEKWHYIASTTYIHALTFRCSRREKLLWSYIRCLQNRSETQLGHVQVKFLFKQLLSSSPFLGGHNNIGEHHCAKLKMSTNKEGAEKDEKREYNDVKSQQTNKTLSKCLSGANLSNFPHPYS